MTGKREPIDLDLFRASGALVPEPAASSVAETTPAAPAVGRQEGEQAGGHWQWSGHDMPRTHRYPTELLEALEDRTSRLKLPVGLTVAAAIASLLDRSDEELEAAVRKAHAARPPRFGRR
ncbi:MAG: hypothetical protein F2817_14280 [Actinobacteria bacterium]|nr:hypothetical protein [Actinomycetota bacterium]